MLKLQDELTAKGHEVRLPAFDSAKGLSSLDVCLRNNRDMVWCDCVYMIWDCRSDGTKFDSGMMIALNKPLRIHWINAKTFQKAFEEYAELSEDWFKENMDG